MEMSVRKLEAGRAEYAFRCAKEGRDIAAGKEIDGKRYRDGDYRSRVRKLPSMVLVNGLGQTLAFIASKRQKEGKEKNAYDLVYRQLSIYFSERCPSIRMPEGRDLCEWVISLDSQDYRQMTNEALAFLSWLGRFAEALIEGE